MSIVVRKKFDIKIKDLTPKTINLEKIKDSTNQLEYLKTQIEDLKYVNEKNIKLALQLKNMRNKKDEYKDQYDKIKKELIKRHKINKELNIMIPCPHLEKILTLYQCNEACKFKLCPPRYNCNKRLETIKSKFILP